MYSIRVVPIKRVAKLEELTYFSAEPIEKGSIVSVQIGRKDVDALVLYTKDIKTDKQEIKKASFKLKKISKVKGPSFLSEHFLEVVELTRRYFVTNGPTVFSALIPSLFLKKIKVEKKEISQNKKQRTSSEKFILQAPHEERWSYYKTLIRESFAKKESVFILVPTWFDAQKLHDFLSHGIEDYSVLFYSGKKDSELTKSFKKTQTETHPLCIIGTGSFLCIQRDDIGTLVVENESSDAYRGIQNPHIDMRVVAYFYASKHNTRLIVADTILRTETLYRLETHEFIEAESLRFRIEKPKSVELVDRKTNKDNRAGFIFGEEVQDVLDQSLKKGENIFLFALRKGFAPTTVCNDCSERVRCPKCKTPLFLFGSDKSTDSPLRRFTCQKCKYVERTNITCRSCGSWNLVALGIGTDRIFETLKEQYPSRAIIQIDKETVKSHKEALEKIEEFENTPGAILVGTELAMYYFTKKVPTSVIVSFDTLFSIPSYTIHEKVIRILDDISEKTENKLFIQTRSPDEGVLRAYTQGTLHDFFRTELEDRKIFAYPPFTTLLKISFRGSSEKVTTIRELLQGEFESYKPDIWENTIAGAKIEHKVSMLIKIPQISWSPEKLAQKNDLDSNLEAKLRSLPFGVMIEVNPTIIL